MSPWALGTSVKYFILLFYFKYFILFYSSNYIIGWDASGLGLCQFAVISYIIDWRDDQQLFFPTLILRSIRTKMLIKKSLESAPYFAWNVSGGAACPLSKLEWVKGEFWILNYQPVYRYFSMDLTPHISILRIPAQQNFALHFIGVVYVIDTIWIVILKIRS